MPATVPPAILEPFLLAADRAARERGDVDRSVARELMEEAATMIHNSLALDDLDEHDTAYAVAALAADLVEPDPSEAVRAREARLAGGEPAVDDPEGVRGAYRVVIQVLGL